MPGGYSLGFSSAMISSSALSAGLSGFRQFSHSRSASQPHQMHDVGIEPGSRQSSSVVQVARNFDHRQALALIAFSPHLISASTLGRYRPPRRQAGELSNRTRPSDLIFAVCRTCDKSSSHPEIRDRVFSCHPCEWFAFSLACSFF